MMVGMRLVASIVCCMGSGYAWVLIPKSGRSTSLMAEKKKKFAQPAFRQPAHQTSERIERYGADSQIASMHERRIRTAGRVGTKRFVNPCKVFVGNMPFDIDAETLQTWLSDQMGQPPAVLLTECKVIRDWKTGKSKGFGFAVFTEPIYATVCIDKCNNIL